MSDRQTVTDQMWVAVGPAGTVGSLHRVQEGFTVRLARRTASSGPYPTLAVAKAALFAALGPGAEYPEFHEH